MDSPGHASPRPVDRTLEPAPIAVPKTVDRRDLAYFAENRSSIARAYGPQAYVAVLDQVIVDADPDHSSLTSRVSHDFPLETPYVASVFSDITRRIAGSYAWVQQNEDDLIMSYGPEIHFAMVDDRIIDMDRDPSAIQSRLEHRRYPDVVVIIDFSVALRKSFGAPLQRAFLYSPYDLEVGPVDDASHT